MNLEPEGHLVEELEPVNAATHLRAKAANVVRRQHDVYAIVNIKPFRMVPKSLGVQRDSAHEAPRTRKISKYIFSPNSVSATRRGCRCPCGQVGKHSSNREL